MTQRTLLVLKDEGRAFGYYFCYVPLGLEQESGRWQKKKKKKSILMSPWLQFLTLLYSRIMYEFHCSTIYTSEK